MTAPLFYRLRSQAWKQAGLPGATKAYELHGLGKLRLVKDAAGRTGVTPSEAERFFAAAEPLCEENKRNVEAAANRRQRAA